jgi:hypothetical protein
MLSSCQPGAWHPLGDPEALVPLAVSVWVRAWGGERSLQPVLLTRILLFGLDLRRPTGTRITNTDIYSIWH